MVLGEHIKRKYGSRFYAKSSQIRKEALKSYLNIFKQYDLLLLPTLVKFPDKLPGADTPLEELIDIGLLNGENACPFNFTGFPALTINYNVEEKLCPISIVGRHFEDHRVTQFARIIELMNK